MPTTDRRPRFWLTFAGAWAILTLLSSLWALATPVGAAPDEPAHLIKAASVVRGQLVGEPSAQGSVVQVPRYIGFTQAQTCYAFAPDESAACIPPVPGNPSDLVDATTTAGLYNPLYYELVGWPSLFLEGGRGILAMRVMSALVASLFLALAIALIARWRRPALPIAAFGVAATPMVLFLGGTVNPNSLEIAATLSAFAGVLTMVRAPAGSRLAPTAVIVIASAAVAANMRGLSLLWLAIALLAPLLLAGRERMIALLRSRPVQLTILGAVLGAVAAGVWLLATNSLGAAIDDPLDPSTAPGVGTSPVFGFAWTLFSTFDYAQGIVGIFGWLDTPAPVFVYFVWAVLAGGLVALGLVLLRGRALALALTLLGALLLLPPVLQGIYIESGGVIWQGRYILPIFVCAVVGVGLVLSDRLVFGRSTATRLLVLVAALWAVGQFQSFATALRRYAVGYYSGWLDLLNAEWAPPGGIFPSLIAFGIATLAASALLVLVGRRAHPDEQLAAGLIEPR